MAAGYAAPTTDVPLDDPPVPVSSVPPTPSVPEPLTPSKVGFIPLVTVVGFHHARGPEVEGWFGVDEGVDPAADYGWSLLPFMALSDGAHALVFRFLSAPSPTSFTSLLPLQLLLWLL